MSARTNTRLSAMALTLLLVAACADGERLYFSNASDSGAGTAAVTGCAGNPCRMFKTATFNNGNLGGASGADTLCQADANKPATGTYKALIADSTTRVACTTANCAGSGAAEHVGWILKANTDYVQTDGVTAVGTTNSLAIFTFPLTAGFSTANNSYWAGFATNWTVGGNCNDWTNGTGGSTGCFGLSGDTTSASISNTCGQPCNSAPFFVCVEQ